MFQKAELLFLEFTKTAEQMAFLAIIQRLSKSKKRVCTIALLGYLQHGNDASSVQNTGVYNYSLPDLPTP